MHFYPNERLALFIDGANLYATAKALGFDIDYKRLLALFRTKGQLVRALYYTALAEDQEYSSIRPLVDWLDYNGCTMVTRHTRSTHQDQRQHGHRGRLLPPNEDACHQKPNHGTVKDPGPMKSLVKFGRRTR